MCDSVLCVVRDEENFSRLLIILFLFPVYTPQFFSIDISVPPPQLDGLEKKTILIFAPIAEKRNSQKHLS